MALTGAKIRSAIKDIDKSTDFTEALAKAIVENLEISIPIGDVIVTVSGGSGAPAVGVKNTSKIKCEVK